MSFARACAGRAAPSSARARRHFEFAMPPWTFADQWEKTWLPWYIQATAEAAVDAGIEPTGFKFHNSRDGGAGADEFRAAIREVAKGVWTANCGVGKERDWQLPTRFDFGVQAFAQPVRTAMIHIRRLANAPDVDVAARAPRPAPFQNSPVAVGIGAHYYENVFTRQELASWVPDEDALTWERFEGDDAGRQQADLGDAFAKEKVEELVRRRVLDRGYVAGKGRAAAVLKNTLEIMPEQKLHVDYAMDSDHRKCCAGAIVAIDDGVYVALAGRHGLHAKEAIQRRYVRPGSVLVFEADCVHAGMGGTGDVGHRRVHFYFGRDMAPKDIPPKRKAGELNTYFLAEPQEVAPVPATNSKKKSRRASRR